MGSLPELSQEGGGASSDSARVPSLGTQKEGSSTVTGTLASHQGYGKRVTGCFASLLGKVIPHGGILSNSFSLASASLGAGVITLPWAFHASGVLMGTIYIVLMTIFTVYTVTILGYVMEKTGYRAFEQMSRGILGKGADYFMAVVMGLSCFGAAVAYVIAAGTLMTPILRHFSGIPEFLRSDSGIRVMTCAVWLLGMLPLVIPKEVNTLRYFSAIGVAFVVYFAVLIVVHACNNGLPKRSEMRLVSSGNVAMEGIGAFVFAYLCHAVAFPAYFEMKVRSTRQLLLSAALSMTACSVVYWTTGFFGYMEFGKGVAESVLYMFDPVAEPLMMVAYVGLIVKLCVSYALNMIPCRNTVYYILGWDINALPYWKHIATVTLISAFVLLCGLFIPRISTAFDLAGALCGGFIGFIYPALFYMYSGGWTLRNVGWFHYTMTYISLIAGVISVVFGTGATIYSTFA
ncbi:putative amino acid transporter, putative,amino acid permease [Trypanosoma conorhini]|uniref:Putative amino acid transporter, putative,amino acid permease n=1 Tax=Trypanosoma conorhini TaxID=83891 RepID=A0A422NTT4_9TRYP|nr:putative amino acid transporter, putative,amino acid permease [Trypanosoma conorhini]RNF08874.1 putative amino acid transporter, putative,amino acid permease [Trypanosoma conorhini]